jgi:hypothetical protein
MRGPPDGRARSHHTPQAQSRGRSCRISGPSAVEKTIKKVDDRMKLERLEFFYSKAKLKEN